MVSLKHLDVKYRNYRTERQGSSRGLVMIPVRRAFQRGGGQRGQFAPGPQFKGGGGPNFQNKKNFRTFFDKNNGLKKHFLNPNFTYIDLKKGFNSCCNRNLSGKIF